MGGQRLGHDLFLNWDQKEHKHNSKKPSDCKGFSQSVWFDWHGSESVGAALKAYPWAGPDNCGGETSGPNHSAAREQLEGLAGQPTAHPLVQSAQEEESNPSWAETWVGAWGAPSGWCPLIAAEFSFV